MLAAVFALMHRDNLPHTTAFTGFHNTVAYHVVHWIFGKYNWLDPPQVYRCAQTLTIIKSQNKINMMYILSLTL